MFYAWENWGVVYESQNSKALQVYEIFEARHFELLEQHID